MQNLSDFSTGTPTGWQSEARRRHVTETMAALDTTVDPAKLTFLSNKSLEEVKQLQQEIAEVVPVGNVTALVLSGLTQLKDRFVPPERAQRDIEALLRGLETVRKLVYGAAFFASPAAVLSAYQKMLTLAGKDVQTAFPDGLWQFYVELSMREDTAHHTHETTGFQHSLAAYAMRLPLPDQLAAWAITIIHLYFQYDALLLTEWSERVYLNLIDQETDQTTEPRDRLFQNLKRKWVLQKPYRREQDARPTETYTQYRQRRFQTFCQPRLQRLQKAQRDVLTTTYQARLAAEAPAFQQQLSILTTLDPGPYKEVRRPIPIWQARVAIIWQDQYHLIPACAIDDQGRPLCYDLHNAQVPAIPLTVAPEQQLHHPDYGPVVVYRSGLVCTAADGKSIGRLEPLPVQQIRYWVWAILTDQYHSNLPATRLDVSLIQQRRNAQSKQRRKLSAQEKVHLELLKMAPVIINWDERAANQPLALARQGRRGIGDHALTIFRTQRSMIFDQSHIFFDGVWGLSLAEIITHEAASWAAYLAQLPPLAPFDDPPRQADPFSLTVVAESAAEAQITALQTMRQVRQNLSQRSPEIIFTINDLLVLTRTLFNRQYEPSPALLAQVESLAASHPEAVEALKLAWARLKETNPAILIPMDAVDSAPRDRLYPISFRNPFPKFLDSFYQTYNALGIHQRDRTAASWTHFNQLRSKLIGELFYFGRLMLMHKKITIDGQNPSLATLKLLGHLPGMMQDLLNKIPQKFDFLNEMLKGEEVFSNVGRMAKGTSPVRFMSASDDNDAKSLVWGILTDDQDVMHLSLRDFRPEVTAFYQLDRPDLARLITQDFLDSYVSSLHHFAAQLNEIASATIEETG